MVDSRASCLYKLASRLGFAYRDAKKKLEQSDQMKFLDVLAEVLDDLGRAIAASGKCIEEPLSCPFPAVRQKLSLFDELAKRPANKHGAVTENTLLSECNSYGVLCNWCGVWQPLPANESAEVDDCRRNAELTSEFDGGVNGRSTSNSEAQTELSRENSVVCGDPAALVEYAINNAVCMMACKVRSDIKILEEHHADELFEIAEDNCMRRLSSNLIEYDMGHDNMDEDPTAALAVVQWACADIMTGLEILQDDMIDSRLERPDLFSICPLLPECFVDSVHDALLLDAEVDDEDSASWTTDQQEDHLRFGIGESSFIQAALQGELTFRRTEDGDYSIEDVTGWGICGCGRNNCKPYELLHESYPALGISSFSAFQTVVDEWKGEEVECI